MALLASEGSSVGLPRLSPPSCVDDRIQRRRLDESFTPEMVEGPVILREILSFDPPSFSDEVACAHAV
jgi:hypothetical protein